MFWGDAMAKYRSHLPQLSGRLFTDGGIETTLIFHEGLEPYFAAFDLLKHNAGEEALRKYFRGYAALARQYGVGCILESAPGAPAPIGE